MIIIYIFTLVSQFLQASEIKDKQQWALHSDMPRIGQSVFDELFGRWEGDTFVYDLPENFEKLYGELEKYGTPVASLIPYGRSLQRPFKIKVPENYLSAFQRFWAEASGKDQGANLELLEKQNMLFNPFQFPRVVLALKSSENKKFPGFIFLGYLEPINQIEVISINKKLGRMEFQIVSNFKDGSKPKVSYIDRDKCMRCHIEGGPIFSRFSWNEGPNSSKVIGLMSRAMSLDNFDNPLAPESKYQGIPLKSPNGQPIETLVKEANLKLLPSLVWQKMCATKKRTDEINCKRKFLQMTLDKTISLMDVQIGNFQNDEDYFEIVGAVTDPLFNNRLIFEDLGPVEGVTDDEKEINILNNHLADLADLVRDFPQEYDPRQIRKNKGYRHKTSLIVSIRNTIGLRYEEDFKQKSLAEQKNSIAKAVSSIPEKILRLPYFDIERIRWHIRTSLGYNTTRPEPSKPLPESLLYKRHHLTGKLKPFERSCARCHTGPSNFPSPFLFGLSQEDVLKKIVAKSELILAYTDGSDPAMPPVWDRHTNEDLKKIRSLLQNLKSSQSKQFDSQTCSSYRPMQYSTPQENLAPISDTRAIELMNHYCNQCHHEQSTYPAAIDFTNIDQLKRNSIIPELLTNAMMPNCDWFPHNGVPSIVERKQLIDWLNER